MRPLSVAQDLTLAGSMLALHGSDRAGRLAAALGRVVAGCCPRLDAAADAARAALDRPHDPARRAALLAAVKALGIARVPARPAADLIDRVAA